MLGASKFHPQIADYTARHGCNLMVMKSVPPRGSVWLLSEYMFLEIIEPHATALWY